MLNKKNIAKLLLAGAMLGVTGCAPTGGPNFEKQADSFFTKKRLFKSY